MTYGCKFNGIPSFRESQILRWNLRLKKINTLGTTWYIKSSRLAESSDEILNSMPGNRPCNTVYMAIGQC